MPEFMYVTETSLEDSFVYKTFNNINSILDKMLQAIKTGTVVGKDLIEEQYFIIRKSHMSPLTMRVLEAYDDGDIEIIYNDNTIKVPTSLPFIVRKSNGEIKATIFISSFTALTKDGVLSIAPKILYCLMESAFIALNIHKNGEKLQKSVLLEKLTMYVYTQMVSRILNKDFSISMDKDLFDKINFVIAKFYLTKIWGNRNEEIVDSRAISVCVNPNTLGIEEVKRLYDENEINDISELLTFIKTLSVRMEGLNIRFFMERYINTYNTSAILSLDYLPYIFFVIINVLLGSFLVSQGALNDIIKNTPKITNFYSELAKIY